MFKFTCHPDGGEKFEVVALSRAITAWENAPGQPRGAHRSVGELTKSFKMADMTDLAWFAASRAGKTGLDIVAWREQVDVELEKYGDDEDDEAGPTEPTP
jgi:hypothetical protein